MQTQSLSQTSIRTILVTQPTTVPADATDAEITALIGTDNWDYPTSLDQSTLPSEDS